MNSPNGEAWLQTDKLEKAVKQGKDYYKMAYDLEKAYKLAIKPKAVKEKQLSTEVD